jgi:hypothetical protein
MDQGRMGLESFPQPGATPFPNPINMFRAYIARQPRITWPVLSIHSKSMCSGGRGRSRYDPESSAR